MCIGVWLSAVVVLGQAAPVSVRPDFSGNWVLVETAAEPPRAQWRPAPELHVRHTERALIVEHTAAPDARPAAATHPFGQRGVIGGRGDDSTSGTLWLGDQLVVGATRRGPQSPDGSRQTLEEMQETWSLDSSGQLVIDLVERRPGAAPVTARLRYARR